MLRRPGAIADSYRPPSLNPHNGGARQFSEPAVKTAAEINNQPDLTDHRSPNPPLQALPEAATGKGEGGVSRHSQDLGPSVLHPQSSCRSLLGSLNH